MLIARDMNQKKLFYFLNEHYKQLVQNQYKKFNHFERFSIRIVGTQKGRPATDF